MRKLLALHRGGRSEPGREWDPFSSRIRFAVVRLGSAVALAAGAATPAWAQLSMNWFTIDGGGTTQAAGGSYSLGGTIGQPDAGLMTGGSFSLGGGFWNGGQGTIGVGEPDEGPSGGAPLSFRLYRAAPNPLVGRTVVSFDMPEARRVRVVVYDAAGRHVRTLAEGPLPAGRHRVVWDGTDDGGRAAATGIYFVRFDAETMHARQKLLILR